MSDPFNNDNFSRPILQEFRRKSVLLPKNIAGSH